MKETKARGGRPKGECQSPVYISVLEKIANEGFQSFAEIRSSVRNAMERESSWRVLNKLTKLGLIDKCLGDTGAVLGWTLTPKGRALLEKSGYKNPRAHYRHPTYRTAYLHDVTLREVKTILTSSQKVSHWVSEHIVKAEAMRKFQAYTDQERSLKILTIPDGLFKLQVGSEVRKSALELEMTRKSAQRIRHKFESHLTHLHFDFVFFVVNGEDLLKVLWSLYKEVLEHSIEIKFQNRLNGLYFTLLENLRAQGTQATFVNGNDSFCFA